MEMRKNRKVYVKRSGGLGDVLWIEPVIRVLAKKNSQVVVITYFTELFENYPEKNVTFIKKVTGFEKLKLGILKILRVSGHYVYLNGAYEKYPNQHFLHAYQKKAGLPLTQELPRLFLTESEKAASCTSQPYVVIHCQSAVQKNYRKIFGIDWNRVAQDIQHMGYRPIFIGQTPGVRDVPIFNQGIRQLIGLIYNARLFIGLDSGPSHIAQSLRIPAIIFFGAVNPAFRIFRPLFSGMVMQKPCAYAGCYHRVRNTVLGPRCRIAGDEGTPLCCVHSNDDLLTHIGEILQAATRCRELG